jgi:hypothetical protein
MPIYSVKLNVPANTPEDNPVSVDITIKQKFIWKMEIGFPKNCNYLVGIQIRYGIKRFWPEDPETWIWGNNEIVSFEERFELPSLNETLTVYGISPGTSYDHEILIRIITLPLGYNFLESLIQKIINFFEKIV